MTADGSTDCADAPAEQELTTAGLHYYELFAALNILSVGGSFVLKMFTMFETSSVCLLYLLTNLFDEVFTCDEMT